MQGDKRFHARLTIGDTCGTLGTEDNPIAFEIIMKRFLAEYKSSQGTGKIILELSNKVLGESMLSRQAQLDAEFESQIQPFNPDLEWMDGVSWGEFNDAFESPEGQSYHRVCQPLNRMSISPDEINALREAYRVRFPRVADLWPKWIT